MPFEILQNDIVRMRADAIVNPADPEPVAGGGTDGAIHEAAGPQLLEARKQIGVLGTGCCAATPAFGLNARYVIHTVGPVWRGGTQDEEQLLRRCYDMALALADSLNCRTIAFPLLSSGAYGFPKEKALRIALAAFRSFLEDHEMQIYLVVWDRDSVRISKLLHDQVVSYVDENYVDWKSRMEYAARPSARPSASAGMPAASRPMQAKRRNKPRQADQMSEELFAMAESAAPEPSLRELLRRTDAGFSETLLSLIDRSGKTDAQIYHRANLSRQHFSKIRSNPDYRPTKQTALALAIALELDLEQTKDLIGRAGYALTNASKFDVIVSYFISRRRYDMFEINAALFEFDQLTLGAS